MWAQTLTSPRTFNLIDVAPPSVEDLGPGQVIVRLATGGICGSDLPYYCGTDGPEVPNYGEPGRPLHEVVGTVVASAEVDLARGSRVVGWAADSRGLAEYFVAQAEHLVTIDDHVDDLSAIVIQPLACVHHALDQIGPVRDMRVAVIGLGPIGLLFTHVLASRGAREVTGVDLVDRQAEADAFGIDTLVHDSSAHWSRTLDQPPQIVVEAVGHQVGTLNDAIEAAAAAGQIYAFGVPDDRCYSLHFHRMFRKDLVLRGGTTRRRAESLRAARAYLDRFPELPARFITDALDTGQAGRAFELAARPKPRQVKVALRAPVAA